MQTRALTFAAVLGLVAQPALADDLVTKESPHDVATTVDRLEQAVEAAGASIVARIDHAEAARSAGFELRPTTVLVFGNPAVGTQLMQENQAIALDLPMRVLVWEDEDGEVHVAYHEVEELLDDYDLDDDLDAAEKLEDALDKLTDQAVAEE